MRTSKSENSIPGYVQHQVYKTGINVRKEYMIDCYRRTYYGGSKAKGIKSRMHPRKLPTACIWLAHELKDVCIGNYRIKT